MIVVTRSSDTANIRKQIKSKFNQVCVKK